MKVLTLFSLLAFAFALTPVRAQVYYQDFSGPVDITLLTGSNSGQFFGGSSPNFNFGDFADNFGGLSVISGELSLGDPGGNTATWHGIDTSGWSAGEYTVSFDVSGLGVTDDYL